MAFTVTKIRIISANTLIGRIYTHYNAPNDYLIEITGEAIQIQLTRPAPLLRQVSGELRPDPAVRDIEVVV